MRKSILILMRHGKSLWNQKNIFTGWVDVPLADKGVEEALSAGKRMSNIPIDCIYTSTLVRAQTTAFLAMSQHSEGKTPVVKHSGKKHEVFDASVLVDTTPVMFAQELNERHYGELQGHNKDAMREKYGKEQVHIWRRSFDVAPPQGESLKMTADRTLPYFTKNILPRVQKGENVLVAAHGNSLRSIVMHIEKLTQDQVVNLEIPTGEPLCFAFANGDFQREDVKQVQMQCSHGK